MTLYEWLSHGCSDDRQRRAKANELADRAGIDRGLMGRYLRGEVSVGARNAKRIEEATSGEISVSELLYPETSAKVG